MPLSLAPMPPVGLLVAWMSRWCQRAKLKAKQLQARQDPKRCKLLVVSYAQRMAAVVIAICILGYKFVSRPRSGSLDPTRSYGLFCSAWPTAVPKWRHVWRYYSTSTSTTSANNYLKNNYIYIEQSTPTQHQALVIWRSG